MIITIDGPTASGKSSVSRFVAAQLGCYYLYTGLLYRAVAHLLLEEGHEAALIAQLAPEHIAQITRSGRLNYQYDAQQKEQAWWDGKNITPLLKSPTIDQAASILSTNNEIRELINELQRAIAQTANIVIDGRDSGSVVFPHAEHKFFLTADADERARRWYAEQRARGVMLTINDAHYMLAVRDERDSNRTHAPLIIPAGAIVIDTSGMTIDQVVAQICAAIIKQG